MKTTNLALLSFLAGTVFLAAVPTTDAASISYVVYSAADAADEDEIEDGDAISVLRKGGGGGVGGGGVGVGGGNSNKECKSGKTRKTLTCKGDVTGKVRLIEGLNCSGLQYTGSEAAITVTNGATLDCQGNTIIGSGNGPVKTFGIKVEKGGTVTNCKVIGFDTGIFSSGPSTITNCVISDTFYYALYYEPDASFPKDTYEAKNVYITGAAYGIYIDLYGNNNKFNNKFKFDSVTIAKSSQYGVYVYGNMVGSSLTFNKITSAAGAYFDQVEGSGTIKIKSSIFDGGGVEYEETGESDIKLSIEKTLIINAPGYGILYDPEPSSSSTLDVSDSSVVLSGGDAGIYVEEGDATLDSVELSGNSGNGLSAYYSDSDVTAKNILVQFNGVDGIFTYSSASVNVNDSKVCQNGDGDDDITNDITSTTNPITLNNVVCGSVDGVTCPNQSGTCTAAEEVATTSCV